MEFGIAGAGIVHCVYDWQLGGGREKDDGSGAWEKLRSRFQGSSTSLASSNGWGSPKRSKPTALEFFWDNLWIKAKQYSADLEVQDQVIHRLAQRDPSPAVPCAPVPGFSRAHSLRERMAAQVGLA